jgi:hypothetical protein
MTAPSPVIVEDDDSIFDAANFVLPIPKIDDRKATKLDIRFSGSGSRHRTSSDDLALLEAMRMGSEVRLIVTGTISGKGFRLSGDDDDGLSYSCTVRVESVEAGEIA